jgi:hypothetical protein
MYSAVEIETGRVIERYEIPPESIPSGTVLIQDSEDEKTIAISLINEFAAKEISLGYVDDNGVLFGLSEHDQLNYTAASSVVNMGAESITVTGETRDDKYFNIVLTNDEARVFFSNLFSHVESILNKYREIKKKALSEVDGVSLSIYVDEAEGLYKEAEEAHAEKIR